MAAPSPDRKEEMNEPHGLEQPPTTRPPRAGFAAFRRVFSRFASAFLLLFLLAAAVFAVSSGFREKVSGFVTAAFDREAPAPEPVSDEPQDTAGVTPRWLPEGYRWQLTYASTNDAAQIMEFQDDDGNDIYITRMNAATASLVIDTEDALVRRDILINGEPSLMSIKGGVLILSWIDEERGSLFSLEITGSEDLLDPEIAQRIAENIQ